MPDKDEEDVNELFDLDIQTVGLVRKGANRRPFFLMKGQNMTEQVLETLEELEKIPEEEKLDRTHWNSLVGVVKSLFGRQEELEAEELEKANDEAAKKAAQDALRTLAKVKGEAAFKDIIAKLTDIAGYPEAEKQAKKPKDEEEEEEEYPEPKSKGKVKKSELEAQLEAIEKAHREKLEKAESRIAELEKAKRVAQLEPVAKSAGLDTEALYEIEQKVSPEHFQKLTERFDAFNNQLKEAGLFKEIGSAQPGEKEPSRVLLSKAEEIKKQLNVSDAEALIAAVQSDPKLWLEHRKRVMTNEGGS